MPLLWHEFSILFLEKFIPQTCKEELRRDFEQLCQGDMTMTQYEMRFADLARHAIWLVPTKRERIKRFIDGLNYGLCYSLAREVEMYARFDQVFKIAKCLELVHRLEREEREVKMTRGSGGFSGTSSGGIVSVCHMDALVLFDPGSTYSYVLSYFWICPVIL
ncbi:uncharacterized protein [Nicotiana tomentosiformis]|uniref:uncharacterized protein n=1 Tax=Nicotiana tomentosiformis TaxID=4098 RepID=UPI00388C7CBA